MLNYTVEQGFDEHRTEDTACFREAGEWDGEGVPAHRCHDNGAALVPRTVCYMFYIPEVLNTFFYVSNTAQSKKSIQNH